MGLQPRKPFVIRDNKIIDFEYLAVNEAAEKMFNVKQSSLIGKRLSDIFKETPSEYLQVYSNVVETGISEKLEFYQATDDRWYETTIVKMLDGIVTTHMDITDR